MKYIVDTNVFRTFFRFYYNDITPGNAENFSVIRTVVVTKSMRGETHNSL